LPLTGNLAFVGQSTTNGLQMAIDEINDKRLLNKKIVLIVEDNKGEPKEAVSGVNKLLNIDEVDLIFSPMTHITGAIKDIVSENNKILFYNSTVRDFADEGEFVFRDYVNNRDVGDISAKIVEELGYKRIGYIGPIMEAGIEIKEGIIDSLSKINIELVEIVEFQPDEKDLKDEVLKLKDKNLDVIVSCSSPIGYALMKALKEMGMIDIPTIQSFAHSLPISNTPEMKELFKENKTLDVWFGISETAMNDTQKIFFDNYEEKFGVIPSPFSVYAYDDAYIIAEVIEQCDSKIDNNCFAEKIKGKEFEGIVEKIEFDNTGNAMRELIITRINEDLEWEEVELGEL
jgi:branched-chain amino acid transport system substrate-binding protein